PSRQKRPAVNSGTDRPPAPGKKAPVENVVAPMILARREKLSNWRYVTGTFQIKIPVGTPETLLGAERSTLAIFKWRLQQMSPANRWYPVLQRYIIYLNARITELGGNPDAIPPSPLG